MNETIIEIFINRVKSIVLTNEKMQDIPLAYLMTLDLPKSTKHFFDQEVELWIREEEEKFTSNDRFDYDMPQVRMLIDQLFDQLKQNASFHISKFNQLLERAVKLEMAYLIEPHRTLSQFIFKDSARVSTMEIYDTLKYFSHYEYYKTAISDYFNSKYLREISQDQFEDLIDKIDQQAFEKDRLETTLQTLKTITDFLSEIQEEKVSKLTIDILHSSLKDRNLNDYLENVEQLKAKTDLDELSFEEVETLLADGVIPGIETDTAEREAAETVPIESLQNIEESQPDISVDTIEVKETEIYEEPDEEPEEEFEDDELEDEQVEKDAPAASSDVANDLADYVASQISSEAPLQNLQDMFKGRLRRRTLKKLFKKNENDYNDFLDRLNHLTSWKAASALIDDEFYNRGVNPYSKEAIAFSDRIYVRFFPKDKYVGEANSIGKF
jgi:hypothetical protein